MNADSISNAIRMFARQHRTTLDFLNGRQTQLLEIGAFVGVVQHYRACGYNTTIQNPTASQEFRVKLGTRGHPADYSHVVCERGAAVCELHSNLSVFGGRDAGVFCVDVAIVNPGVVPTKKGKKAAQPLENSDLISFAEAKKLVIYPMLLAQFVGIVHEITPKFLRRDKKYRLGNDHLHPALIALGSLTPNAQDIVKSFQRRKYNITVAELFDIRLSAAARGHTLSPFIGTISELLQRPTEEQPLPDYNRYLAVADDLDELPVSAATPNPAIAAMDLYGEGNSTDGERDNLG
jgi:hypothetical protein